MGQQKLKNNGKGTAVGNFLRSVNFNSVTDVVSSVLSGDIKGAIQSISNSKDLTAEQVQMALKELEQDVVEMQEVTKRWESDNKADSYLTKNIRPLSLVFLNITLFLGMMLDSIDNGFNIEEHWITLLSGLLTLTYGGYFGARTVEKIFKKK